MEITKRQLMITGLVIFAALSGSATAEAKPSASEYCEHDRCVFGFFCENAPLQATGCDTGVSGLCSQYNCNQMLTE